MPGIDGLRALAVSAVFLYHVGFWWAAGGFLGVETFFVLSGYLITSLLLMDIRQYHRVRLGRFWLRRARRLWPALWLLLLGAVFLARGWAPDAWARLKTDLPAALTYTTNILYITHKIPYFERFGRPPLLQHLWSLAVEEQFYLFWPLVFWGIVRLFQGRSERKSMWGVTAAIFALVAASTLWMAWQYDPLSDPMRLYYGTDTRAAGFLLGSALATFWPPGGRPRARRAADFFGWLGLAGLLFLYWRLDEFQDILYRGGFLVTATATASVLLAAASPRTTLGKFLGLPPLRWIGTRSYAIYLWHWPLLAVFRPQMECTWPLGWCAVAQAIAAGVFAEISYRTVERPIRQMGFRAWGRHVWQKGRRWGTALAAVGLALATAYAVVGLQSNAQSSLPPEAAAQTTPLAAAATPAPTATPTLATHLPTPIPETSVTAPANATATPAHPTPQPTPTPEGLRLTLLGDSIMLSTLPVWQQTLPEGTFYMDAAQGRGLAYLLTLVPALASEGHLAPEVVVHLGTNGSFTNATFDTVMEEFLQNGVKRVYFVNVRSPIRWASLANQQLANGVARWPQQAVLLDWEAYATPHREWFYDDFAHPTPEGARAYVQFILNGMGWSVDLPPQEHTDG